MALISANAKTSATHTHDYYDAAAVFCALLMHERKATGFKDNLIKQQQFDRQLILDVLVLMQMNSQKGMC